MTAQELVNKLCQIMAIHGPDVEIRHSSQEWWKVDYVLVEQQEDKTIVILH